MNRPTMGERASAAAALVSLIAAAGSALVGIALHLLAIHRCIDLAGVNGRTFVNNASLGLYAEVVQAPEYRHAKLRTAAAVLPDLLGPDARPLDLCFTGPDGAEHHTAHLVLVSNNPYQLVPTGGGLGTRERIDGGVLGVVTVMITDAAQASQFLALQAAGQAQRFSGWAEWAAPDFEIRSAGPVAVGVDGEALILEPPLIFTSRPAALRARLPRRTLRRSPAARTVHVLSRSTLTSLARVAAGFTPGAAGPGSAGDRSRPAPAPPSPMR